MIDISKRTLKAWEQRKRNPSGAAKTLIKLCIQNSQAINGYVPYQVIYHLTLS